MWGAGAGAARGAQRAASLPACGLCGVLPLPPRRRVGLGWRLDLAACARREEWRAAARRAAGAAYDASARAAVQCAEAVTALLDASRDYFGRLLQTWSARAAAAVALALGLTTLALNVWGVRALNTRALPAAAAAAARAAGRDVSLGRVRWLSPLGLTGLAPLASVGPVAVGPGAGERSSAVADEVLLSLDAARSLAQLRLVLTVRGVRASVDVVQGPNLSWFGFPDDVVDGPSARDFLPGLAVEGGGEARDADVPLDARPSLADRPAPPESAQHFQPAVGADLPLVRKVPPAKPVRPTHKPPGGAETDAAAASSTAVPHAAAPSAPADGAPPPPGHAPPPFAALSFGGAGGAPRPRAPPPSDSKAASLPSNAVFELQAAPAGLRAGAATADLASATPAAAGGPTADAGSALPGGDVAASEASAEPGEGGAPGSDAGPGSQGNAADPRRPEDGEKRVAADAAVPSEAPDVVPTVSSPAGESLPPTIEPRPKFGPAALMSAPSPPARTRKMPPRPTGPRRSRIQQGSGTVAAARARMDSSAPPVPRYVPAPLQPATAASPAARRGTARLQALLEPRQRPLAGVERLAAGIAPLVTPSDKAGAGATGGCGEEGGAEAGGAVQAASPSPSQDVTMNAVKPETAITASRSGGVAATARSWLASRLARAPSKRVAPPPSAAAATASASARSEGILTALSPSDATYELDPAAPALLHDLAGPRHTDTPPTAPAQPSSQTSKPQKRIGERPSGASPDALPAFTTRAPALKEPPAVAPAQVPGGLKFRVERGQAKARPVKQGEFKGLGSPENAPAAAQAPHDGAAKPEAQLREAVRAPAQPPALPLAWEAGEFALSRGDAPPNSLLSTVEAAADALRRAEAVLLPSQRPSVRAAPAHAFVWRSLRSLLQAAAGQEAVPAATAAAEAVADDAQAEESPAGEEVATAAAGDATAEQAAPGDQGARIDASVSEAAAPAEQTDATPAKPAPRTPAATKGKPGPAVTRPSTLAGALVDDSEPRYRAATEGPPSTLGQAVGALLARLAPDISLGSACLRGATLHAHFAGEAVPRVVEGVNASLWLARDARSLTLDISGVAHEREVGSVRCTMPDTPAARSLRPGARRAPLARGPADVPVPVEDAEACQRASDAPRFEVDDAVAARGWWSPRSTPDGGVRRAPTGGRLDVHVIARGLGLAAQPEFRLAVRGDNLHLPLLERVLDIPIDGYGGRLSGDLVAHFHDPATWRFPDLSGRVRGSGLGFHFWGAPDDCDGVDVDLVFEGDTMYVHRAAGRFGSVGVVVAGDVGLDPEAGSYRLSAETAAVDVNTLRDSLGVRPLPVPVAGKVKGSLHVGGPLDAPIFTGTAVAVRPDGGAGARWGLCPARADAAVAPASEDRPPEPSAAVDALAATPDAAAAYDRVPFESAAAVFTLDTGTDMLLVHSLAATPTGGGSVAVRGRLWVAPTAEEDARAVRLTLEAADLPADALLARYLPPGVALPPGAALGRASGSGTLAGSAVDAALDATWAAPDADAVGALALRADRITASLKAPALEATATLHTVPVSLEAMRAAVTQAAATALAVPDVRGADVDVEFKGLDVAPLASARGVGAPSRAPSRTRLRLAGRARFSGRLDPACDPGTRSFGGDLTLDGLRLNQLKLARSLAGRVDAGPNGLRLHARGPRPDEALDVELGLPLTGGGSGEGGAGAGAALPTPARPLRDAARVFGPSLVPRQAVPGARARGAAPDPATPTPAPCAGGRLSLRCGRLAVTVDADVAAGAADVSVRGLALDELELASLRGTVDEATLSVDLAAALGRARVAVSGPRFSGLAGDALAASLRWERDVLRLERATLQQARSRYEVQGEYVLPPSAALPRSAADVAAAAAAAAAAPAESKAAAVAGGGLGEGAAPAGGLSGGRWRLQVSVPGAELEEVVPGARLLRRAATLAPPDAYEAAKASFLAKLADARQVAAGLTAQAGDAVDVAARAARAAAAASAEDRARDDKKEAAQAARPARGGAAGWLAAYRAARAPPPPRRVGPLPGLQDLRGSWSGTLQAYGGGGGPSNADFDLRGAAWRWGDVALDAVVANGSAHSEEGLRLEEASLRSGGATLLLRGSLFGAAQDARVLLTDFPVATLNTLLRAVPALRHAAPAARPPPAAGSGPPGGGGGGLVAALGLPQLLQRGGPPDAAASPVDGLLYLRGDLGGSAGAPTGEVSLRLFDGVLGPTPLALAEASASLDAGQRLSFSCALEPADARGGGHVRASGSVPLRPPGGVGLGKEAEAKAGPGGEGAAAAREGAGAGAGGGASDGTAAAAAAASTTTDPATPTPAVAAPAPDDSVSMDVSVRDGGTTLVTALTPGVRWLGGAADASLSVRGTLAAPVVSARARVAKGALAVPWLRSPATSVTADVSLVDGVVRVDALDARVGRRGHVSAGGSLPLGPAPGAAGDGLAVDVAALDVRVRSLYTGLVDAALRVRRCASAPVLGGNVRLSRGVASLLPQAADGGGDSGAAASLQGGGSGVPVPPPAASPGPTPAPPTLTLRGLDVYLGPELRAVYPFVVNVGLSGKLSVDGVPARGAPGLRVFGGVTLDGGEANLLATQLVLDREHANRITFDGGPASDPVVDVALRGAGVRAAIQSRASGWRQALVLTPTAAPGAGDAAAELGAADAARLFERSLARALVADDGQLALSALAASAAHGFMPKIQTQGQLGQARWRLVSAPSIPGLLSLDPARGGGAAPSLLESLALGTEVEVQFGNSLRAALARSLADADGGAAACTLTYSLTRRLRVQFALGGAAPGPRSLVLQYSSDA